MKSADDILALWMERRKFYQPMHAAMANIASIYNGEATIDLPDMGREELSSVPNLLAQGVDQMAGRIASVTPIPRFASEKPGDRAADRRARTSGDVIGGWWETERIKLKNKTRGRHLIAFGLTPATVRYDRKLKQPVRDVRDPRETFPSLDRIPGTTQPTDIIFAYARTVGWLRAQGYGDHISYITGRHDARADDVMTLLEYTDEHGIVVCLAGYSDPQAYLHNWTQYGLSAPSGLRAIAIEVVQTDGIMVASCPTRLTLSRPGGQFDAMTGMYYTQAKLMALEVLAVEKGIFPDVYLESRAGEIARFIDGPHDGRTGLVNVVAGGVIREQQNNPGYKSEQAIDRLERSQRVTAGIPSEFGGESGTNIRTGRRGDAVLSAVIDFPVSEAQDVLAYGLVDENKAAIALAKKFDLGETRRLFVGLGNSRKAITYVAEKVFTHDEHVVQYPVVGTDMNSLIIGIGQRVGLGTMSKWTAAELDPFIDDAETEHDRIIAEGLEQSLVAGIQQQASTGAIPPMTLAKVMTLVKNDRMELAEAMTKVTEEAMKAQAEQQAAPPGTPPTVDQAAAPGAAALTGSPIPGASQGQQDLGTLLSTLRKPVMAVSNRAGTVSPETGRAAV